MSLMNSRPDKWIIMLTALQYHFGFAEVSIQRSKENHSVNGFKDSIFPSDYHYICEKSISLFYFFISDIAYLLFGGLIHCSHISWRKEQSCPFGRISSDLSPLTYIALSHTNKKRIETLANGYSSESTQCQLSNEYKHDRV